MPSANSTTHSPEAPGDGNDESSMNAGRADAEPNDAESASAEPDDAGASTNAEGSDVEPDFLAATCFLSE